MKFPRYIGDGLAAFDEIFYSLILLPPSRLYNRPPARKKSIQSNELLEHQNGCAALLDKGDDREGNRGLPAGVQPGAMDDGGSGDALWCIATRAEFHRSQSLIGGVVDQLRHTPGKR